MRTLNMWFSFTTVQFDNTFKFCNFTIKMAPAVYLVLYSGLIGIKVYILGTADFDLNILELKC